MSKKQNKINPVVLAYGEVTGHKHAFYGDDTVELEGNTLIVKEKDALKHEEHSAQTVAPIVNPDGTVTPAKGTVIIQREYQMGSLRRVTD